MACEKKKTSQESIAKVLGVEAIKFTFISLTIDRINYANEKCFNALRFQCENCEWDVIDLPMRIISMVQVNFIKDMFEITLQRIHAERSVDTLLLKVSGHRPSVHRM